MSEDAPVNTGAVRWPEPDPAYFAVRRMQTKLHRWAGENSSRRFGDLFNLVYDPAFLVHAFERVAANAGARTAGVDGVTVAHIKAQPDGVRVLLDQIRNSLKTGEYRPVEVRQVMIPKGTTGKFRKLGIPTVVDRVVQASLKAVLEPIFEADFKPCSYGFRPNRRSQDAIAEIHQLSSGRSDYHWILEADIELSLGAGVRHQSLFRRNFAPGLDGALAGKGQGQARVRAGESVPEIRGHDGRRGPGRDADGSPARRDPFTVAR